MLKHVLGSLAALTLIAACGESPAAPNAADSQAPRFVTGGKGNGWVQMVTGGGTNTLGGPVTEWISLSVRKDADGNVSGNYEYANEGFQNWRYHGVPDCMAVSADGLRAVVIGPMTRSQTSTLEVGTRVGFYIVDNGTGANDDAAVAFFAGDATCAQVLTQSRATRPNSGNYNISTR